MANIKQFPNRGVPLGDVEHAKGQPNPSVVAAIKAILAKAESGSLQAFASVMLIEGGHVEIGFVPNPDTSERAATMVGAVVSLQMALVNVQGMLTASENMALAMKCKTDEPPK